MIASGVPRLAQALVMVGIPLLLAVCSDPRAPDRSGAVAAGRLSEEVRIDGHEHVLVPINSVTVTEDGTVAIGQPQDFGIRFFDGSGRPLNSVGRRGAGPGDFSSIGRLGWYADTLWAYDGMLNRITLVSPERAFVRTLPVPVPARPAPADEGRIPEFTFVGPAALYSDGAMLASLQPIAGEAVPEPFRDRVSYGRINADGVIERILTTLPDAGSSLRMTTGIVSVPFANRAHVGIAPDGSRMVVALASLTGEDAGTLHVAALDTNGDTLFARRLPLEVEAIPPSARDSAVEATAARLRRDTPALADEFTRRVRVPEFYPPINAVVVGGDGSTWLELRPAGVRAYLVLRPDGEPLGRLELPSNARLAAATRDRIWTVERDELDVGSVVRYAVAW